MSDEELVNLINNAMNEINMLAILGPHGVIDTRAKIGELKQIIATHKDQITNMSKQLKEELKAAKMNTVRAFPGTTITELTFADLANKAGFPGLLSDAPAIEEEEDELLREPGNGDAYVTAEIQVSPADKHDMQESAEMYSHILPYALRDMFYCNENGLLKYPPKPNMGIQAVTQGSFANDAAVRLAIQKGIYPGPFATEHKDVPRVIRVKNNTGYKFYKVTLAKETPDENTGLMSFILSPLQESDLAGIVGEINVYTVEYSDDAQFTDHKLYPKGLTCTRMTSSNLLSANDGCKHSDIHVLFRGTADGSGAMRDMLESHAGKETFIAAYPYIKQCLSEKVEAIANKSEINLTISGHSLGGADTQNFATAILMDITSRRKLIISLNDKLRLERNPTMIATLNKKIQELQRTFLEEIRNVTINHNSSAPVTEEVASSCYSAANDFLGGGGNLRMKIIYRDGDAVPHLGGVHILSSVNDMEGLLRNGEGTFGVRMAKITHPTFIVSDKMKAGYDVVTSGFQGMVSGSVGGTVAALTSGVVSAGFAFSKEIAKGKMDAAEQSHTAKMDSVPDEIMQILDVSRLSDNDHMIRIAETLGSGIGSRAVEKARVFRNAAFSKTGAKHGDIAETLELQFFDIQDDKTKERMIPSLPDKIVKATEEDIHRYCDKLLDYLLADKGRLITFANSEHGLAALGKLLIANSVDELAKSPNILELLALVGNSSQFNSFLKHRNQLKKSSRKGMVLTFLCLRLAHGEPAAAGMIETYIRDITSADLSLRGTWNEYTDVRGGPDNLTPMEYIARSGDIDLLKTLSLMESKPTFSVFRSGFTDIFNINQNNIISILNKATDNERGHTFVRGFLLLDNIQSLLKHLLSNDEGIKTLAKILAKHNIEPNIITKNSRNDKLNLQYQVAKNLSNDDYLANLNVDQTTVDVFIETIMQANSEQIKRISHGILTKRIGEKTIVNLCMETEGGKLALHKIAQHMKDIPTVVRNKLANVEIGVGHKTEHFGYIFADSPMFMFRKHRTKDLKNEATLYQLVSKGDCEAVKEMTTPILTNDVYNIYMTETVLTLAAKQGDFKMFDTLVSLDNGRNVEIANIRTQMKGSNISAPLTCLCAHLENDVLRGAAKESIIKFMQNITITNRFLGGTWNEYTDVRGGPDNLTAMEYIAKSGDASLLTELSTMEATFGVGITQAFGGNTSHKFVHIFCINEEKAKEILKHVPQGAAGYEFAEKFCSIVNAQLGLSGEKEIKPPTANPDIPNPAGFGM